MNALLTALIVVLASPAIHQAADAQDPLEQQTVPQQNTTLGSAGVQSVYSRHGGNVAATMQAGRGNSSSITQSGDGHRAENDQGGDAGFTLNQSGQPGEIVVRQNGR